MSGKLVISMQDKLGFLFETPLESFEANSKPTEYDIVCRWIFEYDKVRGTKRFMNKKEKSQVLQNVTDDFMSLWRFESFETLKEPEVKKKLRSVISRAENYIDNGSYANQKSNEAFIESEKKGFSGILDIALESITPRKTGTKRKSEEMVVSKLTMSTSKS